MTERAHIPAKTEVEVLEKSRRRCCLCAYIDGDWRQKMGQIAHLDRNRGNPRLSNLVWLCFDHHSEYDSTTRQHKNYQEAEVRQYRERLYDEVADRVASGIVMADAAAVTPFVLVVGVPEWQPEYAKSTLMNFSGSPGLVTEVIIWRQTDVIYRWRGKFVIKREEEVGFQVNYWLPSRSPEAPERPLPVATDRNLFQIEVCDLGEVVTRRRTGVVGRHFQ